MSAENWLKDAMTITFSKPEHRAKLKHSFNGLRIIFEPQLGTLLQTSEDSFEAKNFQSLQRIGLETNIYKGFITLQGLFFYPSTVELGEENTLRAGNFMLDPNGRVIVDFGLGAGLSFFDGTVAVGYGGLFYDEKDFRGILDRRERAPLEDNFFYLNIQPISMIKAAIKNL